MFKCKFCEHSSDRSDNIKRHEDEKHRKMLKVCTNCGKSYTASALSRHKKTCKKEAATTIDPSMLQKDADVAAVLGANNIEYDQIAGVVEHTMNIKFITLKNGTVISLANEISVGGYTFTLNQKSIEPDGNYHKMEKFIMNLLMVMKTVPICFSFRT